MSETNAMRYDTPDNELGNVSRLRGTDYAKVTVTKINGEWLETVPRLGDEIRLSIVATVVEVGKRLTDDGLQATAKLEVAGITVEE